MPWRSALLVMTFATMTSVVMAMETIYEGLNEDLDADDVASQHDIQPPLLLQPAAVETNVAQHTLVSLNPAEGSIIDCEDLAPPLQALSVFIARIFYPSTPGVYVDFLEQSWNVSDYDAFAQFIGNGHDYVLSSDPVRPVGVYPDQSTGMISVIYDFIKDNDSDQFFSLELTRTPEEYRIAREQENREYHVMRKMQDREYQEVLAQDRALRERQTQQTELTMMPEKDAFSCLSINALPLRASTPPPQLPLTKEQLRAHNAVMFAKMFLMEK